MLENLFSIPMIILYAILFGATEKIADLLNEHKLKWFKGSVILFGFLFGFFGALLVFSNNVIANILLAMVLGCLIRNRIDYLNHQIAVCIIIVSYIIWATFNPFLVGIFFLIVLIFGSLKDYVDDVLKRKDWVYHLNELMLYYPIPTFIYCLLYGNWIVFWAFLVYTIAYDTTKFIYKKKGYH